MRQWYWYRPLPEGKVRLLRVFGKDSDVVIPGKIAAGCVAEIGSYCFSEKEVAEDYLICTEEKMFQKICQDGSRADWRAGEYEERDRAFTELCSREGFIALAGKNVTNIVLPDTLNKIGNFAFYQCRELKQIVLGTEPLEIGSDAFMNCRCLNRFYFRGSAEDSSCLKQILAQRSAETEIYFMENGTIQAALVYPEYSEHYDLIGPAHIFELNIRGEGFRARQCFQNGCIDFAAYDGVFAMECGEESADTLCRMACSRLQYPVRLQETARDLYESYVRENIRMVCDSMIAERNLSGIKKFYDLGFLEKGKLQHCIEAAVTAGWTEGVRAMLSLREDGSGEETAYAFKDF